MDLLGRFWKKEELPVAEQKWNKMWGLWVAGKAESPYAELMAYESEVNNGGHSQYFFNAANCGDLKAAAETLLMSLPEPLLENFREAYEAFSAQEDICGNENDDQFDRCDDVFYEREQLLLDILKAYAGKLELD